uniref:C-type lectin domain-containing protein n=1 Tax=Scophthalmus maximus TaxID=52904 RepID=A0A8D2ZEC7_SCOMX
QSQLRTEYDQLSIEQDKLKNQQRSDHSQLRSNQSQQRSEHNQLRSDHSQLRGKQNQQRSEHNQLRSEHDQLKLLMNATLNKMALLFPEKKKEKEYCGDWVKHASSCFLLSKDEKNWDQARKDCHVNNSDLAVILNSEDQEFMSRLAAWIGLTDKKDEKNFVWVNGEGIKPDVTYWGHGEPNNALASWDATKAGQDCVGIVVRSVCRKEIRPVGL